MLNRNLAVCAEAGHGDLVVGERSARREGGARSRVANDLVVYGEELAQVAGAPCGRSHGRSGRSGDAPFGLLVVHEEERPVFLDGAAERAAEDVLAERLLFHVAAVVEEAVGIELIVAQELEHIAVVLVGAALQRHHDAGAADVAEFGAGIAGNHFHFFQRVHVRLITDLVIHALVDVHAIEDEVVGLLAIAVHLRTRTGALEAGGGVHRARRGGNGARDQQGQARRSCGR